jgi:hypothetical protein
MNGGDALSTFTASLVESRGLPTAAEVEGFLAGGFTETDILQLTLVGGPSALTVTDTTPTHRAGRAENTLGPAGYQASVSALRIASLVLALGGLLMLCLGGLASARAATSEAAAIKRRYATMLLQVEPMTSPPGRPVVDVTDFPALARLAERYGLLVMHWTRSNVDTFIVHDDGITYRYRTGTGHTQPPASGTGQAVEDTSGRPA